MLIELIELQFGSKKITFFIISIQKGEKKARSRWERKLKARKNESDYVLTDFSFGFSWLRIWLDFS